MMRAYPARPLRPQCSHRRLRHLLARTLPGDLLLGASTLRPWASANFVGARHFFPCTRRTDDSMAGPADLQQRLAAIEWRLPGHLVADLLVEVSAQSDEVTIEILTVEE